jgi:hypothetical protein
MSTWHQQQAIKRNGPYKVTHPTIISDPPNELQTWMSFTTKKQAEEVLAGWIEKGLVDKLWTRIALPEGWRDPE